MAARQSKRQQTRDPILQQLGVYCCEQCFRPLVLEKVLVADVERRGGAATGFIVFEHFCECGPAGSVFATRVLGSYPSFLALFGGQPSFPYRAPFAWRPVDDDDPFLARWVWEIDQVTGFEDLMLFLDDAANRRAA